jgi:hypothetical protein
VEELAASDVPELAKRTTESATTLRRQVTHFQAAQQMKSRDLNKFFQKWGVLRQRSQFLGFWKDAD